MLDDRPQADRVLAARIHGTAKAHARWRELTEAEHAAAVGELCELAGERADLLAETAGLLEGTSEGKLEEPLARQAAGLCRAAGADPDAIPGWIEEGRRRAASLRPAAAGTGGRSRKGPASDPRLPPG
jgi:hypothetical protein